MSEDWAIKIEHLSKVYKIFDKPTDRVKEALNPFRRRYSRDFYALNDVSLTIKKGETVGIIGKNGAGKSTILKIITGVLTPTSGSVQVNGRIASLLELGAGFNPEMTGIENIYMNGTIMGYSKEEIDDRLHTIIAFADIGEFIHQPVKMYSSGMFARLAFAVNAFVEPDILIVDEALSVGDAFFQQKCLYRMNEMRNNGCTILFVSHSLNTVKALCKRCIFLCNGNVVADGNSDKVCDIYQNKTSFKQKESVLLDEEIVVRQFGNCKSNFYVEDALLSKRMTERSGGGEVKVVAFNFYDNGKICSSIKMCSSLNMMLSIFVEKNIEKGAAVGILCRDKMGYDIFSGNLNFYNEFLPALTAGEKIVLDIQLKVSLAPGEYFFGYGIKPHPLSGYFYDRGFNAAKILIEQPSEIKYAVGGCVFAELKQFEIYRG